MGREQISKMVFLCVWWKSRKWEMSTYQMGTYVTRIKVPPSFSMVPIYYWKRFLLLDYVQ